MLEPLLYFAGTILATAVVAVLFCHYRFARHKWISWGTVVTSSLVTNVCIFLGMGIYEEGWRIFTREAWTGGKGGLGLVFFVLGIITIFCLLPALGVAVF